MCNYRFSTINQLLWAAYGAAKDNFMDDPNLQDLVLTRSPSSPPLSHLILNAQQKPHGCRAQWTRHKRSGMFCVLSGQDAEKLRKRQSYRHGQGHVRWHDQLELSQHVLLSAGIWPNAPDLAYKPRLDICSALSETLELKETILFPSEKCRTNMLPVPKFEESTCIWKRCLVEGAPSIVPSLILVLILNSSSCWSVHFKGVVYSISS